ncbi:MAG: DUF6655 family protein [Thalassobaculum sp.]|uniref:DUF6655 family protein n=1 Tax=Thalassobaculum sp. TaxID=2022740 RepID=UPI0032EDF6CF
MPGETTRRDGGGSDLGIRVPHARTAADCAPRNNGAGRPVVQVEPAGDNCAGRPAPRPSAAPTKSPVMPAFPVGSTVAAILIATQVAACTSTRRSTPERTATEQILLSTAVDRAVQRLQVGLPAGTAVYIDAGRFEAYDEDYAIAAVRDRFLAAGCRIAGNRGEAEAVVEIRSGALSTDESDALVGIPSFSIPIPLAGDFDTPELALLKQNRRRGIAKIAFTAYWTASGALADRTDPIIGIAGYDDWKFLGLGWHDGDVIPSDLPPEAGRRRDERPEKGGLPEKSGSAEADP